ncbi:helix-turn-helix domain-containing protein [Azoarcus taiwanensis]|uniref:Helix-turn-helix domain-containing protein n=1 Tax=Azoarcus taiwanensis TaxID=666964 RepID=A0A972F8J5_9RHOO|nr:helix-turn-helix domain-containing protein [Azoarcus taiwanensis]
MSTNDCINRYLTSREAAEYLRVAEQSLRHDRVSGRWGIKYYKLRGRIVYSVRDLEEHIEARAIIPASKAAPPTEQKVRKGRSTKLEQLQARREGISVTELRRRASRGGV